MMATEISADDADVLAWVMSQTQPTGLNLNPLELPKEEAPKINTPREIKKEEPLKIEPPKEEIKKEESPKIEPPKEEIKKEEAPKIETSKDESPTTEITIDEALKIETPKDDKIVNTPNQSNSEHINNEVKISPEVTNILQKEYPKIENKSEEIKKRRGHKK